MQASYLDFLLQGVSFSSNAYCYQEENKPYMLEETHLNKIRQVWSKFFWISAGLCLSTTAGFVFSLSVITSPIWIKVARIGFICLSTFLLVRLCQAANQELSWSKKFCDLNKTLECLKKDVKIVEGLNKKVPNLIATE